MPLSLSVSTLPLYLPSVKANVSPKSHILLKSVKPLKGCSLVSLPVSLQTRQVLGGKLPFSASLLNILNAPYSLFFPLTETPKLILLYINFLFWMLI